MKANAKIRKRDNNYTDITINQDNAQMGAIRVPNSESDLWLILLNDPSCMERALEILVTNQEVKLKTERKQKEKNEIVAKQKRESIAKAEAAESQKATEIKETVLRAEAEITEKRLAAETEAAETAKLKLVEGGQDDEVQGSGEQAESGSRDGESGAGAKEGAETGEEHPDEDIPVAIDETDPSASVEDSGQVGSEETPETNKKGDHMETGSGTDSGSDPHSEDSDQGTPG